MRRKTTIVLTLSLIAIAAFNIWISAAPGDEIGRAHV